MFHSVLVVCVGNICRSPVGERLLAAKVPGLAVSSAGIGALAGHAADATMAAVAARHGLSLEGHVARQFTPHMGGSSDLILVMEPGHRRDILRQAPQLAGRVMLFDRWTGGLGISDPYRHPPEIHEQIFSELSAASDAWAKQLGSRGSR